MTALLIFFAVTAERLIFNHVVLQSTYERFQFVWREPNQMRALFPLIFASYALFAFFFAWIYAKGYEAGKPGLAQGLRFALLAWPFAILSGQLADAPFLRIPLRFFALWSVDGLLACLVAGVVAGLMIKAK